MECTVITFWEPFREFSYKQQVGQLALGVQASPSVLGVRWILVAAEILKIDARPVSQDGRHHNNPAGCRVAQPLPQQVGQQEMAQVVHAVVNLKPILRGFLGRKIHSSIVD